MSDSEVWLKDWFRERGTSVEGSLEINIYEAGWIDSFAIVELIAEVEEHFNIKFEEKHIQDRRFSTILGMSNIINGIIE